MRLSCGYHAMKVLDLSFARATHPPVLRSLGRGPSTPSERTLYAYRLFKEMRYESFDIATVKPRKNRPNATYYATIYTLIPALHALFPRQAELGILFVLLSIYTIFEGGHAILRPSSQAPLFEEPFLAPTLASFWSRRWHALILSPLSSLCFEPFSKIGGRPAGVLAAFILSGVWHAWAVMPLGKWKLAWRVVVVLVMQALGTMLEWGVWGKRKTWLRRVCACAWMLGWAGWVLRSYDDRARYWL
jgi:hypothetical protein